MATSNKSVAQLVRGSYNDEDIFEVQISDQTSPSVILPFTQLIATTTLAEDAVLYEYTITVTATTGFVVGQHIRIINQLADRYYSGTILNIVGSVITLDTQIDYVYMATSQVTGSNINMNVNGSVTPVIFTMRNGSPNAPTIIDITQIAMSAICVSAVDFDKFGDLTALARGLTIRLVDGTVANILNVKSNRDIATIMEYTAHLATNPAQGTDGFNSKMKFAGQQNVGVALRVGEDDNLQVIVQDDLTGLTSLVMYAIGHDVQG